MNKREINIKITYTTLQLGEGKFWVEVFSNVVKTALDEEGFETKFEYGQRGRVFDDLRQIVVESG